MKKAIGAHLSSSKTLLAALDNCQLSNSTALAMFLKPPRTWNSIRSHPLSDLTPDVCHQFKSKAHEIGLDLESNCVPHSSYLINLANPVLTGDRRQRTLDFLIDDLKRCDLLGIGKYNIHPGSTCGHSSDKFTGIKLLAEDLNKCLAETDRVCILLEQMAYGNNANVLGTTFEDLRQIIDLIDDKFKSIDGRERIGVCLDTCHMFAAGYDLHSSASAYNRTFEEFDTIIGRKYLKCIHLNDSHCAFGSGRDRHADLGKGKMASSDLLRWLMVDRRLDEVPFIMETPSCADLNLVKADIEMLRQLENGE